MVPVELTHCAAAWGFGVRFRCKHLGDKALGLESLEVARVGVEALAYSVPQGKKCLSFRVRASGLQRQFLSGPGFKKGCNSFTLNRSQAHPSGMPAALCSLLASQLRLSPSRM